ncbi:MAG: glycosyltransferase [Saonia sp.]
MQDPLVSILIPFKNTAAFLPECIRSILNQDYQNWEVWAINDHSSDNSMAIVKNFAKNDRRINVRENNGNGIIEALRLGLLQSKGRLVTRMDSDDIMKPNKLQVLVNMLLEYGKGHLAVGQVKYFSTEGISNGYRRYEAWLNQLTQAGINYSEIYKECVIPSPCWMAYREDLEWCDAFMPDRYPEDYDLAFRFYEKRLWCIPCSEVLHLWRDYGTRTSRTSEHYAQNYFLDIKLYYFLKLDYDPNRPLALWGAGNKGKSIAKGLLDHHINFLWLCDNPNKIGKDIYGQKMLHYSSLEKMHAPQSIVTVANEESQIAIKAYFCNLGKEAMKDYFFFC